MIKENFRIILLYIGFLIFLTAVYIMVRETMLGAILNEATKV